MQVVLRYAKGSDQLTMHFHSAPSPRRGVLTDDVTIGVDDQRKLVDLTIKRFSQFHNFGPLLDLINTDGIAEISRFQSEARNGVQRRTVTINPKPLSRRMYENLTAA